MNLTDPRDLAGELAPADRWLLVLDFDGTLSPIVEHPDDAAPAAGAVDAVRAVAEHTPVVVLSGRPVSELLGRLGDLPVTFAGGHGAEVRTADGERTALVDPAALRRTLDSAQRELEALLDPDDGWIVERKDASLAVHDRQVPAAERERLGPRARAVLEERRDDPPGFEVLAGKAVLELRPAGVDKGRALAWVAERTPGRRPLVLGDDVTDEDAFREATARDGDAVLVAEASRDTLARWRIRDPDEVVAFLTALVPRTVKD